MPAMCCIGCSGLSLVAGDHVITDASGRRWTFEFHPYCGPTVLRKDGEPKSVQPSVGSPFWAAFDDWHQKRKATTPPPPQA